jgi:uncharacterized protein (TIGR03435 family)
MKLSVCLAAALSIITITTAAQAPPAPSFDVTSVKRNTSGGGGMQMRNMPGNVSAFNIPVRMLIRQAYQVQDFQVVGAPAWENTDRFDVEGRYDPAALLVGSDTPAQRMSAMMKALLRDRFGMVAHTETREMPILTLTVARSDGRLGPQLKPAAVDCVAMGRGRGPIDGRGGPPPDGRIGLPPLDGRLGGPPLDGRGAPPPGAPFSLGERPACGDRMGFGQLLTGGTPMARLATQVLSQLTGRIVVDRTGLTGTYDIDLKWSPTPDQLPPGPPPPGFVPPPIDPNGPSLYTALQEQLGLKLENARGPVEVLVIEKLVPPTEN